MSVVLQEQKVKVFQDRLNTLYDIIREFAAKNNLETQESSIKRSEERLGSYSVLGLVVNDGSDKVVEFRPFGINIIAAEGRVDAIGKDTTQKIVYMSEGGPEMITKISNGSGEDEEIRRRLYPDVTEEGWYWVHDRPTRRTTRLDDATLPDLFQVVSGYGVR